METTASQGFFGRLGGLLGPQGLTPEEQAQLGRAGLLQAGLGILANNHDRYNAGAAVGSGLLAGVSAMQKGGEETLDRRLKEQQVMRMGGDPASLREFNAMTEGLSGEELKRARRINLGLEGRASSSGYTLVKFKGPDGRERIGTMSGRSGFISMPDGSTFDPRENGAQVQQVAELPAGGIQGIQPGLLEGGPLDFAGDAQQFASLGIPVSSTVRSAEKNRQVGGVSNSYHLSGEAMDIAPRSPQEKARAQEYWRGKGYQVIDEGDHLHIEPPGRGMTSSRLDGGSQMLSFTPAPAFQRPSATAGRNPFVGRTPEEEAAATERAKLQAQQDFLPAELGMRTQAAIQQTQGQEQAKQGVERAGVQATRTRDANDAMGLIAEARRLLPGATGGRLAATGDSVAGFFGSATEGAKANAALKTIAGQMTAKMPRMEGPQSNSDVQMYKEMAGDVANENLPVEIREAALAQIERLQSKYSSSAPIRVQSADDYNRLPPGALYTAPDGSQRRKR